MVGSVTSATQETVERIIRAAGAVNDGVRCNVAVYALALARTFGSSEFILVKDGPSPVCADHVLARIGGVLYDANGPISRTDLHAIYCSEGQKLETLVDRSTGGDAVLRAGGHRTDGLDVRTCMAEMAAALADPNAGIEADDVPEPEFRDEVCLAHVVQPSYRVQMAFGF